MFNVVIFSKNRACQLDLFLRSFECNFKDWENQNVTVIYTATSKEYQLAYDLCFYSHPKIKTFNEVDVDFKNAVLRSVGVEHNYTVFFVDDIVFVRPFENDDRFQRFHRDPNIICLSLRMHPGVKACYTENKPTPPPNISPEGIWNWQENRHNGDWSYPMSLDGHIFRTFSIFAHINNMQYKNPNTMEGVFAQYPLPIPFMMCYPEPRILNIPANKVQTVNSNRSGAVSVEGLNRMFLLGKRISMDPFKNLVKETVHCELTYTFEDAIK